MLGTSVSSMWGNNGFNGLSSSSSEAMKGGMSSPRRSKQSPKTVSPNKQRIRSAITKPFRRGAADPPGGSFAVSETTQGVEVSMNSISSLQQPEPPTKEVPVEVVNVHDYLKKAKKIRKHQFSMNYPLLKNVQTVGGRRLLKSQQHRVELEPTEEILSLQDMIFVLQSHVVKDEITSVQQEHQKMTAEIRALEDDRTELEHEYLHIIPSSPDGDVWDIEYLLKQKPSLQDVTSLQKLRGNCLTIHVSSSATRESICSKLGMTKKQFKLVGTTSRCVTITPSTQNDAARHLGHANIWPSGRNNSSTAFFLHFFELTQAEGAVPPALWNRMKKMALQLEMLRYLTVGPHGSYFCIMTSGHVWWKTLDPDFDIICNNWEIHKVAFGELREVAGVWTQSWIIVARDGRVAHKNLPKRFANLLESRLVDEPAPDQVSLGKDGAYFVRFLDGKVDYCLPARLAKTVDNLVEHGGTITNIMMHPDLHDFIVRHTELKKEKRKPKARSLLSDPFQLFTG